MTTEGIIALAALAAPILTWALDKMGMPTPRWIYGVVAIVSLLALIAAGAMALNHIANGAPATAGGTIIAASPAPPVTVNGSPGSIIAPSGGTNSITNNFGPKKVIPNLTRVGHDSESQNPDGTFAFVRHLKMNAKYDGSLVFLIKAKDIVRASVESTTPREINTPNGTVSITGGGMQQNVMTGQDFYSTTIPTPSGTYDVTVVTGEKTPVTIATKFQD